MFGLDVVASRFIALGGRSLRLLLATLLFAEVVLFPPGRFVDALLEVAGRFEFVVLAVTTPLPLNSPGLALAATAGCP